MEMRGKQGQAGRNRKGFTATLSTLLLLSSVVLLLMLILQVEGRADKENLDIARLGIINSIDTNIGGMAREVYSQSGFVIAGAGGEVNISEDRSASGKLSQNLGALEAWWDASRSANITLEIPNDAKTPLFWIMPQNISVEIKPGKTTVLPQDAPESAGQVEAYSVYEITTCANLSAQWNNLSLGSGPGAVNFTINFTCSNYTYNDFRQLNKYGYSELVLQENAFTPLLTVRVYSPAKMELEKNKPPTYLNLAVEVNGSARVEMPGVLNISIGEARRDGRVVVG
ncbi:MAG: hypothetical protein AB1657_04275 [Candidatus Micrarchaeota archaeon]